MSEKRLYPVCISDDLGEDFTLPTEMFSIVAEMQADDRIEHISFSVTKEGVWEIWIGLTAELDSSKTLFGSVMLSEVPIKCYAYHIGPAFINPILYESVDQLVALMVAANLD